MQGLNDDNPFFFSFFLVFCSDGCRPFHAPRAKSRRAAPPLEAKKRGLLLCFQREASLFTH